MDAIQYELFDTAFGSCAIAWTKRGIAAIELPDGTHAATIARLTRRLGAAEQAKAPRWVRETAQRLSLHLDGKPQDFADIALDMESLAPFHQKVYAAARKVDAGMTVSYGELAQRVGSPGAARAVGQAMAANRFLIVVPCHRVLAANGRLGGFSARGGLDTKKRLLALEGAALGQRSLFDGGAAAPLARAKGLRALRAADPQLAALMAKVGPFRLKLEEMHSPYESLAEAIVYQQLSGKAAATILGRAKALFHPDRFFTPKELAAASDEKLRSAGLSRPKIAALRDLSAKSIAGELPSHDELVAMSDDAIVERLTQVRGVGVWTVHMLLIFRLGRSDVLPSSDYGIRKGLAVMLGKKKALPSPADVERRGERWRPFRTIASWYLWRALEL